MAETFVADQVPIPAHISVSRLLSRSTCRYSSSVIDKIVTSDLTPRRVRTAKEQR